MKKLLPLAFIGCLSLTECSNNEYLGDESGLGSTSISFGSEGSATTRATGEEAAKRLGYQFTVFGTKNVGGGNVVVFPSYDVTYQEGSKSESNTMGWEYVGKGVDGKQTIKYWDYSADSYEFFAWSNTGGAVINSNGTQVTVTNIEQAQKFFISEKTTIKKSSNTNKEVINQYGGIVELRFGALTSKVRLGFYETIPGYDVKIVSFRYDNDSKRSSISDDKVDAYLDGQFNTAGTFTLSHDAEGKLTTSYTPSGASSTYMNFGSIEGYLGTTSTSATYAKPSATESFAYILPNENEAKPLELVVDYTLYNKRTGEDIHVKGARATVPATYTAWRPNYVYTYLFKISDNTNGTTGTEGVDPEGLYPITFDAVVSSSEYGEQETVTIMQIPAITTFSETENVLQFTDYIIREQIYVSTAEVTPTEWHYSFQESKTYESQGPSLTNWTEIPIPADGTDAYFIPRRHGYYVVRLTYQSSGKTQYAYKVVRVGATSGLYLDGGYWHVNFNDMHWYYDLSLNDLPGNHSQSYEAYYVSTDSKHWNESFLKIGLSTIDPNDEPYKYYRDGGDYINIGCSLIDYDKDGTNDFLAVRVPEIISTTYYNLYQDDYLYLHYKIKQNGEIVKELDIYVPTYLYDDDGKDALIHMQ